MPYTVDGDQYIAITVGWGGVLAVAPGIIANKSGKQTNISRVLAFKLGGNTTLPDKPPAEVKTLVLPEREIGESVVAEGKALYHSYCTTCHGDSVVAGGVISDLRYSPALDTDLWSAIVGDGAMENNGMPGFGSALSAEEIVKIESYVIFRAHQTHTSGHD